MTETIIARAPGKALLLGEYAVLEGAPALVAAVDRFAEVTLTLSKSQFSVSSPLIGSRAIQFQISLEGEVTYPPGTSRQVIEQLRFFNTAIRFACQEVHIQKKTLPPAAIRLNTSSFYLEGKDIKLGLGSSAAMTVALLAGLFHNAGLPLISETERLHLFQTALEAHHEAQQKIGSGVDVAASTFGGILQYQVMTESLSMPTLLEELPLPESLYLLFIWSGKSASTQQFVQKVQSFKTKSPKKYHEIMKQMLRTSEQGCRAFSLGHVEQFLKAVREYYRLMDHLGKQSGAPIISEVHQRLAEIVEAAGGVYKPSGAGGGDLGIAFAASNSVISEIKQRLNPTPFQTISLDIAQKGVVSYKQKEE